MNPFNHEYQHPKWKARARDIRQRDNFTCTACFRRGQPLEVHHIVYIEGRHLWEYPDNLLQTLCHSCHGMRHEILKTACDSLKIATANIPTVRLQKVAVRLMAEAMEEMTR